MCKAVKCIHVPYNIENDYQSDYVEFYFIYSWQIKQVGTH